jgi:hypothetical protein
MSSISRQILACYAFFEQSKQSAASPQDSLIPFILPAIAGKASTGFSSKELANDLVPLFGPDAAVPIAESMQDPLIENKYLERDRSVKDSVVYLYTQKANEIPVESSISTGERDLEDIMVALSDYISLTPLIPTLQIPNDQLRDQFVDWVTTLEISKLTDPVDFSSTNTNFHERLHLLFAAFVNWTSRERPNVFDKIARLAELGLVMDLLSELRVPTRRIKHVALAVVLDSRLLLELLGLYGEASQNAIKRLLELCKKYSVSVVTLAHLVDEVREIAYNANKDSEKAYPDSVNEAMQLHPKVKELVKQVFAGPDALIRGHQVTIFPYKHLHDYTAEQYFTDKDIKAFADALPYDPNKPNMARRDAWSLAYAVRRQNGAHTSNLYESKCVILTRSPGFVSTTRTYLRNECGYPSYAVAPVMELRHFSTMFMLSYGVDIGRPVIRSQLVAMCDRIISLSPDLLSKIRQVMTRWEKVPKDQIEAALENPIVLSELAVATANDPSTVTASNGKAIYDIMYKSGQKDAELRHLEAERRLVEAHHIELERERRNADDKQIKVDELTMKVFEQSEQADKLSQLLESQVNSTADSIYSQIIDRINLYWRLVTALTAAICLALMLDMVFHFTEQTSVYFKSLSWVLGAAVAYHTLIAVRPTLGPERLRAWLMKRVAARQLSRYSQSEIRDRVTAKLESNM